MRRIFTAIKIHPSESLIKLIYQLKQAFKNDNIKWVDIQNIHITLKFFGETGEDMITKINHHLAIIANNHHPFKININGSGVFGSSYQPRVIWFGINRSVELKDLATNVLNTMATIGCERDRQNFVPHLTAARIKYIHNKTFLRETMNQYKNMSIQEEYVQEFHLYESILKPQGPVYNILETFKLQ